MAKLISINPSDYKSIGEVETSTEDQIKQVVADARTAQSEWGALPLEARLKVLREVAAKFHEKSEQLSALEAKEMGMPLSDARIDTEATLDFMNWYLDHAVEYLSPETNYETKTEIHTIYHEPVGVIASIVPWNFPFANFVWASIQSLIAGNAVVLKHSEECPLSGKLIEEIMHSANLPEGVFSEVYGDGLVGAQLVAQDIDMITFTGSTKTGKYLYELAGERFIKAVMELGGSAPAVVFADADLSVVTESVCFNRLLNQGQCCDGLKRLIVHKDIADEVVQKLAAVFAAKKVGKAIEESTEIGPLVAKRQLDLLVAQVNDAVQKGATVITGGKSLEQDMGGAFYAPTILTNVTKEMRVWQEEVFGPVLPVITFETEEEAIELANDTAYGLGGYVYTADSDLAERVAKGIKTGMISINGTNYVQPFNPFGGYKNSGFGREHGKFGFHEVTQVKLVARNKF